MLLASRSIRAQWSGTNFSTYLGPVTSFVSIDTSLYAVAAEGIYRASNNGMDWTLIDSMGSVGNSFLDFTVVGSANFVTSQKFGVFLSTNSGSTWITADSGLPSTVTQLAQNINSFASVGSDLFAGISPDAFGIGASGVFVSIDSGEFWKQSNSGLSDTNVTMVAASGSTVFAATPGGLFRSTDNGASWTSAGLAGHQVTAFQSAGSNIFVAFSDSVYLSTDNGSTWSLANNGIPDTVTVTCLAASGANVFAGTSNGAGVFLSTNNGSSWSAVNSGIAVNGYAITSVTALGVFNGYLYASFPGVYTGDFIWQRPLSQMITAIREKGSLLPTRFSLSQNYPNPFNPTTDISYELSSESFVTLKVYNVLGQEVATLVNELKQAGSYTIRFDAGGLASGVYFYRLTAGNFSETKRLMLVK